MKRAAYAALFIIYKNVLKQSEFRNYIDYQK